MITEFVKGKPFFNCSKLKIKQFPYLDKNIECDVLIIGGGITGAISAYYFTKSKIDTVLIEKNRLGFGNTGCATALLEYQLDDYAKELKNEMTEKEIVNVYNMGLKSLTEIEKIIDKLGNRCNYARRDALIFSTKKADISDIKEEFDFRKKHHFDVEFIDETNNPFNFYLTAGLISKNGGAEFQPYLFTKQLIEYTAQKKCRIFENTEATQIIPVGDKIKVITNYGIEIICNKIIASTGYNTKLFTSQKVCNKFISYSVVTNPLPNLVWDKRTLLQDVMNPYHYIRLLPDDRIICGGEDVPFKNSEIKEKQSEKKYDNLLKYLKEMFPSFRNEIVVEYKFCGAFSSTANNMSVIGESSQNKNIYYNFCYGANGIVNSIFGAKILLDAYYGRANKLSKIFMPKRNLV